MQFLKRLVVALACALTLGLACLLALLIQNPETEEHEHTWIIIFLVVLLLAGILIASCLYAIFKSQHYTEENEILNKQLDHEGTMYSSTIFHGTDPQPFYRLFAACFHIYIPEDKLAFPSGICGAYN